MTEKRYGDGSVFNRASDGLWVATYSYKGVRKSAYGKSKQEALKKRRSAEKRISQGQTAAPSKLTFVRAAEQWTTTFSRTLQISEASRKNYVDVLRLHVVPKIGIMKLESIKPSDIAAVLVAMEDKNYSPSYRHQAHKAISHVFRMAVADGDVQSNPVREIHAPRGNVKQTYWANREDVRALIEHAPDERVRMFLVLMAHTGMRIGETLNVKWSDVNFETKSISVFGKGGKLRASYLTPTLADQLNRWRRIQSKQRLAATWWSIEGDWVITTDIGTKMDAHNLRRKHFNPLSAKVCPQATPHSLRHEFATIRECPWFG